MRAPKHPPAGRASIDAPQTRLKYRPQGPTLQKFHTAPAFVRGLIGPLGSGKTMAAINHGLMLSHTQPPDKYGTRWSRGCVARNTFPDLNVSTIPDFRSITDKLPFGEFTMGSPPKWTAEYGREDGTKVRIEVVFRAFDGAQDVKKARGMQLTWVWVDELGEFHKPNFDMLIGRVKRFPPRGQVPNARFEVMFTSNAVARDHWLGELALGHTPENWWIGIQPGGVIRNGNSWVINPLAENLNNLDPRYYLDQLGGKKDSWIRQNLANEFVHHSDGRAIHPDFSEQLHVADLTPTPGIPLYLGMDWGRTPACIVMQQEPTGHWKGLKEIVLTNAGADKLGSAVKQILNKDYQGYTIEAATGDPSGSSMAQTRDETPFELFDEFSDIHSQPAHTNDFDIRVATLDQLLTKLINGRPAIQFDRSCTTAITGLAGEYEFNRIQVSGEERYHDKPNKGPTSHICEAVHYCLMGAGESEVLFNQSYDSMMQELADLTIDRSIYE